MSRPLAWRRVGDHGGALPASARHTPLGHVKISGKSPCSGQQGNTPALVTAALVMDIHRDITEAPLLSLSGARSLSPSGHWSLALTRRRGKPGREGEPTSRGRTRSPILVSMSDSQGGRRGSTRSQRAGWGRNQGETGQLQAKPGSQDPPEGKPPTDTRSWQSSGLILATHRGRRKIHTIPEAIR